MVMLLFSAVQSSFSSTPHFSKVSSICQDSAGKRNKNAKNGKVFSYKTGIRAKLRRGA
jgi:hypothetical protein